MKPHGYAILIENRNIALIPLTQGYFAIVDAEDAPFLGQFKWRVQTNKSKNLLTHYAAREIPKGTPKTSRMMHRTVMKAPDDPKVQVDHVNHNGLDNKKCNLRLCSNSENQRNKVKCWGLAKYKGVFPSGKKWMARIRYDGSPKYLGQFATQEEAARVYDAAAKMFHGTFARLNFPEIVRP